LHRCTSLGGEQGVRGKGIKEIMSEYTEVTVQNNWEKTYDYDALLASGKYKLKLIF